VRAFNPQTNTWTTLAPLHVGRVLPAAAVGPDGRIYVFGGDPDPRKHTSEVYDPGTNRWTKIVGVPHKRAEGFAAATAGDGRIDLIGGCEVTPGQAVGTFYEYCGAPSPVDAYDPRTNRWTKIGVTLNARQALAATTGPDGRVYAVGGGGYGNGKLLEVIR
jgi:N-acetylneuraminic acid mutarotase